MRTRPTILHITGDYPDSISQVTTRAVYNLINHRLMSRSEGDQKEDFDNVMVFDDTMVAEHRW